MTRAGGFDNFAHDVMSGKRRGVVASFLRGGLALAEPFYAAAMSLRNRLYDRGTFATHRLARPAVAVGNITTGGTGKTPVVRWLAERFIERGKRPAILMRGYRSESTGGSDEQGMLESQLGECAIVVANPDRVAGALGAMCRTPPPDVFILDDAFQHRRVGRDFNLVLVSAANPFGFDHVLPRGLLREPLAGLARADAILITHVDAATSDQIAAIKSKILTEVPFILSNHAHAGLLDGNVRHSMEDLQHHRFFLFAGIGDPQSLAKQLPSRSGERWFADHQSYSAQDVEALNDAAKKAGADLLVTTEKDWGKLAPLANQSELPIWRIELKIEFQGDGESRLLNAILERIAPTAGRPNPPAG